MKPFALGLVGLVLVVLVGRDGTAQEKKKRRTGTVTGGMVQSKKKTPNGRNIFLEVLAPGEEKARKYHVVYDPKVKGPNKAVLALVQKAEVGDRVELTWVDTGEGLAIQAFKGLGKKKKE